METLINWIIVLVALGIFAGIGAGSWVAFTELWRRLS